MTDALTLGLGLWLGALTWFMYRTVRSLAASLKSQTALKDAILVLHKRMAIQEKELISLAQEFEEQTS